jgi:hypothetical protein
MRECSPRSGVTERRAATTISQMRCPGEAVRGDVSGDEIIGAEVDAGEAQVAVL